MIAAIADILSWVCIAGGSLALLTGGIGVLRLPDVYTRMHAAGITDKSLYVRAVGNDEGVPETAAEAPPEIPEDSGESEGPAGEGADGAGESPSSTGGEEPAGETGGAAEEPPSGGPAVGDNGGPESDRPDDPTATDKTE